jgi:hypothetical protein
MDPVLIAAIINTAGKISKEIFRGWGKEPESLFRREKKVKKKIKRIIEKYYDQIAKNITPHCLKVLISIESGHARRAKWIWSKVFKKRKYEREFTYRLRYLRANGLVSESMSWFRITKLGRAFLEEARNNPGYWD